MEKITQLNIYTDFEQRMSLATFSRECASLAERFSNKCKTIGNTIYLLCTPTALLALVNQQ